MPVTRDQAAALAQLVVACRPHGARQWDAAGVIAAIGKVKHLALADVALAAFRAADDRSLETPGAIGNPTAHCWKERATDRPAPRQPWNPHDFCETCGQRADHHPATDHEFTTAAQQLAKRGQDYAQRQTAAADYARQALGDAKADGPREPEEREHKPNPNVDRLRAELATATDPETTRAAMAAESGGRP